MRWGPVFRGTFGGIYGAGECFLVLLCRPLLSGTPGACTGCPDVLDVKFVTVVTAVLLDGREFKAFQFAGNIIIAVVGDGVNSLAAMSVAAG